MINNKSRIKILLVTYRPHRAASFDVNWVDPSSLGGSYVCSVLLQTLTCPCHALVLHSWFLSGVMGSLRLRCHLYTHNHRIIIHTAYNIVEICFTLGQSECISDSQGYSFHNQSVSASEPVGEGRAH